MNFFEHQDRARRQTLWLILLFALAVAAIIAVTDLLVLLLLGSATPSAAMEPDTLFASENTPLLIGVSVLTLGIILLASLYRIATLRGGGSGVATELGGVPVEADVQDPLRRRLRNVVEEVALAAGVPVPDIYVMEQESAINAFAAGYTPADAAIAVTRGTLEKLNREQLQGVVAHEFSHILNGDMRLNIRLMGVLFGILMMSIIGRHLLHASSFRSRSSSKNNGGGMALVAIGVIAIGYIGLFFGNWIKAAVSRRREFLADASAVQFTRNPDGIAGALKRIAVDSGVGKLEVDAGEVSHMLFSSSSVAGLLSTHPPLVERIQRVDPGFREQDLASLARRLEQEATVQRQPPDTLEQRPGNAGAAQAAGPAFGGILANIGNPTQQQLLYAALLSASFPDSVQQAAHSPEWAREVLCLVLLDNDLQVREQQLLVIASQLGPDSERQCRYLASQLPRIEPRQRLPLAELCLPALKRRPREDLERLNKAIKALIDADGEIKLFEYAIGRMLSAHIHDALDPAYARAHGRQRLTRLESEAVALLHAVATVGHRGEADIGTALAAGIAAAGLEQPGALRLREHWRQALDRTLEPLDRLNPAGKQALISGLFATVTHDHQVSLEETEILRAICAALHVPLPLVQPD